MPEHLITIILLWGYPARNIATISQPGLVKFLVCKVGLDIKLYSFNVVTVVKTPTSTQHNPKTTSTDVGFDMNMTVQTTHPTPPTPPPELYSGSGESPRQCKLLQS